AHGSGAADDGWLRTRAPDKRPPVAGRSVGHSGPAAAGCSPVPARPEAAAPGDRLPAFLRPATRCRRTGRAARGWGAIARRTARAAYRRLVRAFPVPAWFHYDEVHRRCRGSPGCSVPVDPGIAGTVRDSGPSADRAARGRAPTTTALRRAPGRPQ